MSFVQRLSLLVTGGGENHAASDVPVFDLPIAIMMDLVIICFERSTTKSTSSHYILSAEMQRAGISNIKKSLLAY